MQELVVESPNKKTFKVIQDVENGADLIEAENVADLFKKLGI